MCKHQINLNNEKDHEYLDHATTMLEDNHTDELFPAAVEIVLETGSASVCMLQRRLKLGYSRAAGLMDLMEQKGCVGLFNGTTPRQVFITRAQWQEIQSGSPFETASDGVSSGTQTTNTYL